MNSLLSLGATPAATFFGFFLFRIARLFAGAGKQQYCHRQNQHCRYACQRQQSAWGLCSAVIRLHIKTGENQRRRKRVGREQEAALEEQNAIPQEERQKRPAQVGPTHLAENQDHRHTDQAGIESGCDYASELEDDRNLPPNARKQAGIIRRESEKMKRLIDDLNLTTKLEYALQPVHFKDVDWVETSRQAVSEVLNSGLDSRYEIVFAEMQPGRTIHLLGDEGLLRRMLDNLLRKIGRASCRERV